jgi:cardiolipin synthase A/B
MLDWLPSDAPWWLASTILAVDWVIRLALGLRVVMRRGTVGFTLAWLAVLLLLPVLGAVIYLLLGERRLGTTRARRIEALRVPYRAWLDDLAAHFPAAATGLGPAAGMMRRQALGAVGIPALPGNRLELISEQDAFFSRLIEDIAACHTTCHLEFYIWEIGGRADDVAQALAAAAARGVTCRVLVDDIGSAAFLRSEVRTRLEAAGVRVLSMLPVGFFRALFARLDLRNHRKLAVLDGLVGYTGSQNIVDPELFKAGTGLGQWVDAMVRLQGPAVEALQVTFLGDWAFETGEDLKDAAVRFDVRRNDVCGDAIVQVVPSGPGLAPLTIQELILTAIYGSRDDLVLTTPYFIPDDAMMKALIGAAARGVEVTLVVPLRPDGRLVKLAGEAYFEELLSAGVRITRFEGGVLHTKAITVDREVAMVGSVNLDMRSFYLNQEISLLVYNREFAGQVRRLQEDYIGQSANLSAAVWAQRPFKLRLAQNTAQLLSPLL